MTGKINCPSVGEEQEVCYAFSKDGKSLQCHQYDCPNHLVNVFKEHPEQFRWLYDSLTSGNRSP
jgi:hypothetical protein